MKYLLFYIIFPSLIFAYSGDNSVILRSGELKIGRHCIVPWNHSWYQGEILRISEEMLTVKIFDHTLHVKDWPIIEIHKSSARKIQPYVEDSLVGLINSLKEIHVLETPAIEQAMLTIDRAWFCPKFPYHDGSVYIGHNSCISSPHMHVIMLELGKEKFPSATSILDLGSGSGYLAAIMANLSPHAKVYGVECLQELVEQSNHTIKKNVPQDLLDQIEIVQGDGEIGFLKGAPYDLIHVGFMCEKIPQSLIDQLRPGGRIIIPVGNAPSRYQGLLLGQLTIIDKLQDGSLVQNSVLSCCFVPSMHSDKYIPQSQFEK